MTGERCSELFWTSLQSLGVWLCFSCLLERLNSKSCHLDLLHSVLEISKTSSKPIEISSIFESYKDDCTSHFCLMYLLLSSTLGDWTEGLVYPRQLLHFWASATVLFCLETESHSVDQADLELISEVEADLELGSFLPASWVLGMQTAITKPGCINVS